ARPHGRPGRDRGYARRSPQRRRRDPRSHHGAVAADARIGHRAGAARDHGGAASTTRNGSQPNRVSSGSVSVLPTKPNTQTWRAVVFAAPWIYTATSRTYFDGTLRSASLGTKKYCPAIRTSIAIAAACPPGSVWHRLTLPPSSSR